MKKCRSIVLITALILSLAAVSCGQSARESRPETIPEAAENAGTIREAAVEASEGAGSTEETVPEAAEKSGTMEESGADAVFPAGNPEDVAAVILHTNDVHAGLEDNIGYDGLALYRKELEARYDHVLLIDAGDAIQGAAIGAMSKGEEIIKIMNRLEYAFISNALFSSFLTETPYR